MKAYQDRIQHEKIVASLAQLAQRIEERFPNSGLLQLTQEIQSEVKGIPDSFVVISQSPRAFGFFKFLVIALVIGAIAGMVSQIEMTQDFWTAGVFSQVLASLVQLAVYVGILILFVFTFEKKVKTKKALACMNAYREFAHLIDLHQLAKDPTTFLKNYQPSSASRKNDLGKFLMSRYLAYCNELLSFLGKATALYVHQFPFEPLMSAADQIEDLTTGLSIRIWQKNSVLIQDKIDG